jgi:hypothetical protein
MRSLFIFLAGLCLPSQAGPVVRPIFAGTASELECKDHGSQTEMVRLADKTTLGKFKTLTECEDARGSATSGVVCTWFTPGMKIGSESWDETGWRPTNVETELGLGRRPLSKLSDCNTVVKSAAGGTVCTNTGLGFKPTNIETGMWCGSSSEMQYCVKATAAARDKHVCSFPSSGSGAGNGWALTQITNACKYIGKSESLKDCNARVP